MVFDIIPRRSNLELHAQELGRQRQLRDVVSDSDGDGVPGCGGGGDGEGGGGGGVSSVDGGGSGGGGIALFDVHFRHLSERILGF